jgi:hypothetical protein
MATLNIGGQRVSIDDGFLQLAPEQQQATVEEIAASLPKSTPSTESGGVVAAIDNGARQLVKGIPVLGGAMDKIAAAGDAATYSFLGRGSPGENFSERYAKNKISEAGKDAAFETAHPNISTALQLTGGVAGTLPLAATAIGARGLGLVGSTGARVAQGAAGGAAIGSADAATRGNDIGTGTLVGGTLGGFSPFLGRVAGSTPDALQGFQPKAVDKVTREFSDDAVDPTALQRLGPDAMLMDAGPNLRLQGEALATQPGSASRIIGDAVTERHNLAGSRITDSVDNALGPYRNSGTRRALPSRRGRHLATCSTVRPSIRRVRLMSVRPSNRSTTSCHRILPVAVRLTPTALRRR